MDKSHCAGAHMITFFFKKSCGTKQVWNIDRREIVLNSVVTTYSSSDFIASKRDRYTWYRIIIETELLTSVHSQKLTVIIITLSKFFQLQTCFLILLKNNPLSAIKRFLYNSKCACSSPEFLLK